MFKKNNKEIKLETSRQIEERTEKPASFSTSHGVLQADLCVLLAIGEGRRDKKWIEDFIALRDQCIKLDIWEGFNIKYNLHRGFTAQYV